MKNRFYWLIACFLVLSLLLGSSALVAAEEPSQDDVVTIKWLMLNNWGVEGSGFLEEFYKEYPNIQVEMEATTINQLYEAIQVRVGGGAPDPDVFMVNGPMTASYAYRGLLMPLDDLFTDEEKARLQNIVEQWKQRRAAVGGADTANQTKVQIELKAAEKHPPFSAFHPCLSGQTKLDKNK